MIGKIVGENAVLADDGKEYFCSSIDLKAVNASVGDEIEFTPKGSRAVNFKIIQKAERNLRNERANSQNFDNQKFRQEKFEPKKPNSFENSQNEEQDLNKNYNPNKDDDDFWDGVDTEKSTKEYFANKAKLNKNSPAYKLVFYFIVVFIILNFLATLFGSIRIIKVFG